MRYKFTFKKNSSPTGLSSVGYGTPSTIVKYHGQEVGELSTDDSWIGEHTGRWTFRIKINNRRGGNCVWRWATLKAKDFASEQEGREYIKENAKRIYDIMADIYKDDADRGFCI